MVLLTMEYDVSDNIPDNIEFSIDTGNGKELWNMETVTDRYGKALSVKYSYDVALKTKQIADNSSYPPKVTNVEIPKDVTLYVETKNGFAFTNDVLEKVDSNSYPFRVVIKYEGSNISKSTVYTVSSNNDTDLTLDNLGFIFIALPETDKLPYTKIYSMSEDSLNSLSKFAYVDREIVDMSTGTVTTVTENYGKYITGLYVFPYNVLTDENEITDVFLGDKNTEVDGIAVTEHIKIVNLGSIIIPKDISKGVGYKNVTIDLYLPYFNKINLDVDEVLGGKIDLTLHLNLITGKGTINIRNYDTDSVIHSESTQIGVKIPYELSDSINVNIGSEVLETDYTVPYVEMKVLRPENSASLFPVNKIDIDKDFNYIKDSDDLIFSTIATEREQKLIKDMVSRGVFVRK